MYAVMAHNKTWNQPLGIGKPLWQPRTNLLGGPGTVENDLAAAASSDGDTGDSDETAEATAASEDGWEEAVITIYKSDEI